MLTFYTSINMAYFAKAKVLAESVKRFHPESTFCVVLTDYLPELDDADMKHIDHLILVDDLSIQNWKRWLFGHTVIEACTAVKGAALQYIRDKLNADYGVYLDPDVVLFESLTPLLERLEGKSMLLTPHLLVSEDKDFPIYYNEVLCALKHGTYNLGFLGVSFKHDEGRRLADWWSRRLLEYCLIDHDRGLFTDQKWFNLVPDQFSDVHVSHSPKYNVSNWNVTQRHISGSIPDNLYVNEEPLGFFHFSGVNKKVPEKLHDQFGLKGSKFLELVGWYREKCINAGERKFASMRWGYGHYSNGDLISEPERRYYRDSSEMQEMFPDPFNADEDGTYCKYLRSSESLLEDMRMLYDKDYMLSSAREMRAIRQAKYYKIYKKIKRLCGRTGLF